MIVFHFKAESAAWNLVFLARLIHIHTTIHTFNCLLHVLNTPLEFWLWPGCHGSRIDNESQSFMKVQNIFIHWVIIKNQYLTKTVKHWVTIKNQYLTKTAKHWVNIRASECQKVANTGIFQNIKSSVYQCIFRRTLPKFLALTALWHKF